MDATLTLTLDAHPLTGGFFGYAAAGPSARGLPVGGETLGEVLDNAFDLGAACLAVALDQVVLQLIVNGLPAWVADDRHRSDLHALTYFSRSSILTQYTRLRVDQLGAG